MSAYHYAIVLDIILGTCTSFNASTLMIREYWKAPASMAIRYIPMFLIIIFLGLTVVYQRGRKGSPEWQPSTNRNASAILLPAACFLDPNFHVFKDMAGARLSDIGSPMRAFAIPELWLWLPNVYILAIGFVTNILYYFKAFRNTNPYNGRNGHILRKVVLAYKIFVVLAYWATIMYCWIHILQRKNWVRKSGWLETNKQGLSEEDDWSGIGQIAPLAGLAALLIILFDRFKVDTSSDEQRKDPTTQDNGWYPLQDVP